MEHVDQLLDRVLTLERFVDVLQAFSVQHSERVQTLSAILGVPVPPTGPPPATPAVRRTGNTGNTGTLRICRPARDREQPFRARSTAANRHPQLIGGPDAPGVRDPASTTGTGYTSSPGSTRFQLETFSSTEPTVQFWLR